MVEYWGGGGGGGVKFRRAAKQIQNVVGWMGVKHMILL